MRNKNNKHLKIHILKKVNQMKKRKKKYVSFV